MADNIVLGAGIAGLDYSYACNHNCTIYEQDDFIGGLCHSFTVDGFTFDSAVHLSFANDTTVRSIFDQASYHTHLPIAYNFYQGQWLKHPVANNLYPLPVEQKTRLISSYINRDTRREMKTYADYLQVNFGKEIANTFPGVYTRKYWASNPEDLSLTWVGNRLCAPDLNKVLFGAMSQDTGIDYYAKEMRYPKEGGYEGFLEPLKEGAKVCLNKKAIALDLKKKEVHFSDGTHVAFDTLASSLPLPELVRITADAPAEVVEAADRLWATQISIVSIGFSKPDIPKYLFMYIYDEDILAARINSPSIKSPSNVPEGCCSLQFEIYHKPGDKIDADAVIKNVEYALEKMQFCNKDDILFMDYRLLPYGNVVFYQGLEADRDVVKHFYENNGIDLIGRFGEWDYLWSDQSFLSGHAKGKTVR